MLAIGPSEIAIILAALVIIGSEAWVLILVWQDKKLRVSHKVLWTLGILIFHVFAALYYFFVVYESSSKTEKA